MSESLRLRRAERAVRRRLQPLLDARGISFDQWLVLVALEEVPGLRMGELAESSTLPPATLTRHVDRLVDHALVVRRIDAEDRRIAVVALSGLGAKVVSDLRAADSAAQATATGERKVTGIDS